MTAIQHNISTHLLSRLQLFYAKCSHPVLNNDECVLQPVHILHFSMLLAHHQHKTKQEIVSESGRVPYMNADQNSENLTTQSDQIKLAGRPELNPWSDLYSKVLK